MLLSGYVERSVLLIGNFLSTSGGSRGVCEELALRLEAAGWVVLTASDKAGRVQRLLDMVRTAWQRRADYEVAQVDVYSGAAFFWAEAVSWVLRRAEKPYVLTLRGGNLPAFARRWPGRMRRLLRSAHTVTAPSRYLQQQMRTYRSDLRLLPNPLDLACYPYRSRATPAPRLIWLRAFHGIYNPVLAIEVLARLLAMYPEAHLTMVGPDKGDGSFEATTQRAVGLGVADRVQFVGGVPKKAVPYWLNQGDIFINTTGIDNTPVSVMEAMACGLCVISTNVGGIPYLLAHDQDALLVPPDDVHSMAGAVGRVLEEPHLADRLSRRAREKTEQWDWSAILPQWEQLLLEVANEVSG